MARGTIFATLLASDSSHQSIEISCKTDSHEKWQ